MGYNENIQQLCLIQHYLKHLLFTFDSLFNVDPSIFYQRFNGANTFSLFPSHWLNSLIRSGNVQRKENVGDCSEKIVC